jgi:hypothetical protein
MFDLQVKPRHFDEHLRPGEQPERSDVHLNAPLHGEGSALGPISPGGPVVDPTLARDLFAHYADASPPPPDANAEAQARQQATGFRHPAVPDVHGPGVCRAAYHDAQGHAHYRDDGMPVVRSDEPCTPEPPPPRTQPASRPGYGASDYRIVPSVGAPDPIAGTHHDGTDAQHQQDQHADQSRHDGTAPNGLGHILGNAIPPRTGSSVGAQIFNAVRGALVGQPEEAPQGTEQH